MTFVTVITTNTFPPLVDVDLNGIFRGEMYGNVNDATTVCTTMLLVDQIFEKTNGTGINVEDFLNITSSGSQIRFEEGIIIGNSSTNATTFDSVAIGKNANAATTNSIAIGRFAQATTGTYAIAIGSGTTGTGGPGTPAAIADAENTIAIGHRAYSNQNNSIAIGKYSWTGGESTIGIGRYAYCYMDGDIAIGDQCTAGSGNFTSPSVAIGYLSAVGGFSDQAVSIGSYADADGDNSTAVGGSAQATYINSTAIGSSALAQSTYTTAVGQGAEAYGVGSVSIGCQSDTGGTTSTGAVAVGFRATVLNSDYSVAIGGGRNGGAHLDSGARAEGDRCVAVGSRSLAGGTGSDDTVSIGYNNKCAFEKSVTIGAEINLTGGTDRSKTVVIGYDAGVGIDAHGAIAIGYNTVVGISSSTGQYAIGIGGGSSQSDAADARGNESIAIGRDSYTSITATSAIAIGGAAGTRVGASASATDAIVIGADSSGGAANVIVIGYGVSSSTVDAIALGSPTPTNTSATATAWGQTFSDRGWVGGGTTLATINNDGDIVRSSSGLLDTDLDMGCNNISNVEALEVSTIRAKDAGPSITIDDHMFVTGNAVISGNLYVGGNLTTVSTEQIIIEDNKIVVNSGELGAGVDGGTGNAGIEIDRGLSTNYVICFDEVKNCTLVGEIGSEQCVATREDDPIDNGIAFWNETLDRFDTDTGFTYNPTTNTLLTGNVNLDCGNIIGVEDLHVNDVFGKNSPINFQDVINVTSAGAQIRFEDGIEIGNTTTSAGTDSISLGKGATSSGTNAVAIGLSANASTQDGVAIGNNSNSSATNAISIGYNAQSSASGTHNVAIGRDALTMNTGGYCVAVGHYALINGTGFQNTAIGYRSMASATTAFNNVATGSWTMYSITTGQRNSAFGESALTSVTEGFENTAVGYASIWNVTTGNRNTGVGARAGQNITTGDYNVAIGRRAADSLTTGNTNVAIGTFADVAATIDNQISIGYNSSTGSAGAIAIGKDANASGTDTIAIGENSQGSATSNKSVSVGKNSLAVNTGGFSVAVGYNVLNDSTTGANTGVGTAVLAQATTATGSTSVGSYSLYSVSTASRNCAFGAYTMFNATTGERNSAFGYYALQNVSLGSNNVAIGGYSGSSITTGNTNVAIGTNSDVAATIDNQIAIGYGAIATAEDDIVFGRPSGSVGMTGNATAWGQVFQSRDWDNSTDKIAGINSTGDLYKTDIDTSALGDLGNITSWCLTGSRTGTGNVTLSPSPSIPTDEIWGFSIDVTGRQESSGSIFYERQTILAFNNAGTVEVDKITTVSSLGKGALSADEVIVQGSGSDLEVVVTTGSAGTTNWTAKLMITQVS